MGNWESVLGFVEHFVFVSRKLKDRFEIGLCSYVGGCFVFGLFGVILQVSIREWQLLGCC